MTEAWSEGDPIDLLDFEFNPGEDDGLCIELQLLRSQSAFKSQSGMQVDLQKEKKLWACICNWKQLVILRLQCAARFGILLFTKHFLGYNAQAFILCTTCFSKSRSPCKDANSMLRIS